jgi:hypothetical protein
MISTFQIQGVNERIKQPAIIVSRGVTLDVTRMIEANSLATTVKTQ